MVLAERIGKPRSFARGLLLSIATVGVYAIYWNYRTHNELYRQFELSKEGRDEGVVWLVLGIILPPFLVPYFWIMVSNVKYVRDRMHLTRSLRPGIFVALLSVGIGAYLAASIFIVGLELAGQLEPNPDPNADLTPAELLAGEVLISAIIVFLATVPYAYFRLQADMNEVWAAYDRRMIELTAPPPPAAADLIPAVPAPSEVRYLADLAPTRPPDEPPP